MPWTIHAQAHDTEHQLLGGGNVTRCSFLNHPSFTMTKTGHCYCLISKALMVTSVPESLSQTITIVIILQ